MTRPSTLGARDFHLDLERVPNDGARSVTRSSARGGGATSLAAVTATFENVGTARASLPTSGGAYIPARGYGGVGKSLRSRAPQTFYMLTITCSRGQVE